MCTVMQASKLPWFANGKFYNRLDFRFGDLLYTVKTQSSFKKKEKRKNSAPVRKNKLKFCHILRKEQSKS